MRQRPLSPHIGVYKFAYTMATSIVHRATGIVLSAGLLALAGWLIAAAGGPEAYAIAVAILGGPFGQLLLAGWSVAFSYHLFNGLRHLNWDLGRGLEKHEARRSAVIVVVATLLLAGASIYAAFFAGVLR
ncbi:MAG: succinate dehydrogenase, cytochrome b556 subunit [Gammaproteobacteria bacterium]|nr:succinate dehydrogenase, cytochrome b556 subunit [Gammaproteobacteria bacterium]